jgi:hypothetical protein
LLKRIAHIDTDMVIRAERILQGYSTTYTEICNNIKNKMTRTTKIAKSAVITGATVLTRKLSKKLKNKKIKN